MSEFIFMLLLVYIPIILIMYFVSKIASKPKENHILGATIPLNKMDSDQVKDIVKQYLKANNYYLLFMIITAAISFLLQSNETIFISYMIIWIFVVVVVQCLFSRKYFNKIQTLKKENEWFVPNDKDKYWGLFFYNNPNDDNFMVETNSGYGSTINMAKKSAKILMAIVAILTIGALGGAVFSIQWFNNANVEMNIEDNKVSINAPLYDYDFNPKDVKSIELIGSLPKGQKTNGVGTEKVALGNYKLDVFGKSKVYVHKDVNIVIMIKLKDTYVFYNCKTEKETIDIYSKLISMKK